MGINIFCECVFCIGQRNQLLSRFFSILGKFSMLNDLEEVLLLFAKSPFVPSPTLFLFQLALKLYGEKR